MSTLGETSTHAVDTRGRHTRSTHAIAECPTAVALAAAGGVLGGTLQLVLHILGGEQRRPRAARSSAMMGRVVAPSALDDGTPIEQTTGLLQVLQACLDEHNQAIPDGPYVALVQPHKADPPAAAPPQGGAAQRAVPTTAVRAPVHAPRGLGGRCVARTARLRAHDQHSRAGRGPVSGPGRLKRGRVTTGQTASRLESTYDCKNNANLALVTRPSYDCQKKTLILHL